MTYTTTTSNSGSVIQNVNDLSTILQTTQLKDIPTWDSFMGLPLSPVSHYFTYTTVVPLTSPNNAPDFLKDWDFCYDISAQDTTDFAVFQTVNFGKNRGTTQSVTIPNTLPDFATSWTVRAYFKVESYPVGGTFYQTQYSSNAVFVIDNLII